MHITVENVRNATSDEWKNYWENCDYSTYFHSKEWADIWNQYTGGKIYPNPKIVTYSDGIEILLPFSCQKSFKGLAKYYYLSPGGTFGGILSEKYLETPYLQCIYDFIRKKYKNLYWRFNPYHFEMLQIKKKNEIYHDTTRCISLNTNFENIVKNYHKNAKRGYKKAIKNGIKIVKSLDINSWKKYYDVYKDSLKRWGENATSSYEWSFFQSIIEKNSDNINLFTAIFENEIIAGGVILYSKNHAIYWHGAVLENFMNLSSFNLIIHEIIRDSIERGCKWFDFNPSGGHLNVEKFKISFGSITKPCPVVETEGNIMILSKKIIETIRNFK